MVDFQNLFDPILIIMIVILTGFSIYTYKITNPPLQGKIKWLLIALRSISLALLLFAIFNTVIGFSTNESKTRHNLFFIDNSKSIGVKDSLRRAELASKFISDFSYSAANKFYSFGNKIAPINNPKIEFNQPYTNFEDIERFVSQQNEDIASIIILSDGIITDGANPLYGLEKLSVPVFTVALGDSSEKSDVILQEPQYNEIIYRGHSTPIEAKILNKNFAGKNITVKLIEENRVVDQKNLLLSNTGIDNIKFDYIPQTTGEKRLTLSIPPIKEENSIHNNSRSFLVNVLSDKIKTYLLSASPSADVAGMTDILLRNGRIKLKSVVELNSTRQIKGGGSEFPIDSTDLFILMNYPASNSNADLWGQIKKQLIERHKPFLVFTGSGTDLTRLKELNSALPFTIENTSNEGMTIEVYSDILNNPLIRQADLQLWEQLPPVDRIKGGITAKAESEIILKAKIKNVKTETPVILSRQLNDSKSIAVIADNFWKWKLQSNGKLDYLFDNFITNSLQWLNNPAGKKFFSIIPGKRVYSSGEKIEITSYLYDDLFNPVENAEINITVNASGKIYKSVIPYSGGGLYKTEIDNAGAGNLKIAGNVKIFNKTLTDSLTVYIERDENEFINTQMDTRFLRQMAKSANGSFYIVNDYSGLKEKLEKLSVYEKNNLKKSFEIRFASNEIILIILILLFTFEWVIRKIYRLL